MSVTYTFYRSPNLIKFVSIINAVLLPLNGIVGFVFKTPVWKQGDLTPWISVPFSVLLGLAPLFLAIHDRSLDEAIDHMIPGFYANSDGGIARFLAFIGAMTMLGLNIFWIVVSYRTLQ